MEELEVSSGVLDAPEVMDEVTVEKPKVARTDEIRAGDRLRQIKSRAKKSERDKIVAYRRDSPQEPTRSPLNPVPANAVQNLLNQSVGELEVVLKKLLG